MSYSQNGCFEIDWENNYGGTARDWGTAIIATDDGNYAMAGYSRSDNIDVSNNNGDWDFWIIKIADTGDLIWEHNYGGSQNDEATSIEQTSDGGYVVAGATFSNDGDVSNNNGEEDFWVIKLDANGELEWERTYGGSEVDRAESIRQTADGGYVVAGFSASSDGDFSSNFGSFDFRLIKLDADGNLLWEKNYGGSGPDWAYELDLTTDGGFILAGSTISENEDVLANNGFYDYWLVKTDALGELEWSRNYGGSGEDRAYYVRQAPDGNYIISGSTYSNNADVGSNYGASDFWVIKVDQIGGDLIWENNFGGQGSEWSWAFDITDDGGIAITGRTSTFNGSGNVSSINGGNDFWLVKISADGIFEWENAYGGSDGEVPYAVIETADQGFIIAGYSESSDFDVSENNGDWDYWVLKIKPRELVLDLGNDTTLCTNDILLLDASVETGNTFEWQDGSDLATFLVTEPGWFQVDVRVGDCLLKDSILVEYIDIETADLGPDTSICFSENEPFLLDATLDNANSYFWQNGTTDGVQLVQQSGRYWVDIDIDGCISSDTIDISFNNPQIDLGRDTFKCEFESLTLNAFYPEAEYLWSNGSTDRKLILGDTGTYWVQLDLNGCLNSDTIHVGLCEIVNDPCLQFPNAFTPNADGFNDIFRPVSFCRLESYQLAVFNRWGQQVFVSDQISNGWDGFSDNRKPVSGVYVYVAEFEYLEDGIIYNQSVKGVLTLIP